MAPILLGNPDCQVMILGSDGVGYGAKPKDFGNWRGRRLSEVAVDAERVHFLGKLLKFATAHLPNACCSIPRNLENVIFAKKSSALLIWPQSH